MKRRVEGDEGITLVEMLIAIFVVGFAVIAMTSTLVTSFTAVVRNETLVHATAVANEALEELHALPWNALALSEDDVAAVGDDGQFEGEDLVVAGDPDVPLLPSARPTVEEKVERGWRDFDIEIYVTWVADGEVDNAYKRMTVVVASEGRDGPRSMRVQGVRTPTPEEEALAGLELHLTSVQPSSGMEINPAGCHPNDDGPDCGKYPSPIKVTAVATQPVGSVKLTYLERGKVTPTTVFMLYTPDRKVWETTIPSGRKFVNGETVFTVTTTGEDGEVVDDTRRVVFLHPLDVLKFEADRDFCVNEEGELQEPVTVTIDLVGADPTLRGDGLPVFWATDPETWAEDPEGVAGPDGDALLFEDDESPWGGIFALEFSLDEDAVEMPPLWDGEGEAPKTVTLTVGPLTSLLDDEPLFHSDEFGLTQVAEGEPC